MAVEPLEGDGGAALAGQRVGLCQSDDAFLGEDGEKRGKDGGAIRRSSDQIDRDLVPVELVHLCLLDSPTGIPSRGRFSIARPGEAVGA